jgi:hypothetical protein
MKKLLVHISKNIIDEKFVSKKNINFYTIIILVQMENIILALISKNIIDENILALKILFLHLYRKKYE